jgi:hypothetical protein
MATKTNRIELRVDDAFIEALAKLSARTHKNRAEVIRDALNYYSNQIKEWDSSHSSEREIEARAYSLL